MNKESLKIATNKCLNAIDKLDIPITDKVELMINLRHFLDSKKYEDNIKVLRKKMNK